MFSIILKQKNNVFSLAMSCSWEWLMGGVWYGIAGANGWLDTVRVFFSGGLLGWVYQKMPRNVWCEHTPRERFKRTSFPLKWYSLSGCLYRCSWRRAENQCLLIICILNVECELEIHLQPKWFTCFCKYLIFLLIFQHSNFILIF